eukprot:6586829-Karenia_brevis.AAC.1
MPSYGAHLLVTWDGCALSQGGPGGAAACLWTRQYKHGQGFWKFSAVFYVGLKMTTSVKAEVKGAELAVEALRFCM